MQTGKSEAGFPDVAGRSWVVVATLVEIMVGSGALWSISMWGLLRPAVCINGVPELDGLTWKILLNWRILGGYPYLQEHQFYGLYKPSLNSGFMIGFPTVWISRDYCVIFVGVIERWDMSCIASFLSCSLCSIQVLGNGFWCHFSILLVWRIWMVDHGKLIICLLTPNVPFFAGITPCDFPTFCWINYRFPLTIESYPDSEFSHLLLVNYVQLLIV